MNPEEMSERYDRTAAEQWAEFYRERPTEPPEMDFKDEVEQRAFNMVMGLVERTEMDETDALRVYQRWVQIRRMGMLGYMQDGKFK